jgi:prolyl-tRNA synthetase
MADSTPTTSTAPDLTSREKAASKEVDMTQVAANAEKKAPKPKKEPKQKPAQQPKQQQQKKKGDDSQALIGITTAKEDDLADWYQQVLQKGEMLEYSDIPGFYILNVRHHIARVR